MPRLRPGIGVTASARGAVLLAIGGITAAFGVAACCALPIVLTSLGLGAAWLGGVASIAAPYRDLLLWLSALSLAGSAILLFRMQHTATACESLRGVCTPRWLRALLLLGLLGGGTLLWLGYSYA